ncbi:MAG: class I SAM-dependent methyltransferase [Pedobacter sp.]|nr:class I SAM-dependent methyltransferase [Pedobacter sp.]MDQ8051984.1 class I SAM-dependent methyltransferase [Pedobacter sp.]
MDKTHHANSPWETFWKENPVGFNATMVQSTLFFAKNLAHELPIQADDRILDIGCGPGYLIDDLKGKCAHIHGTDISEKYIAICSEKYATEPEITLSVSKAYDYGHYEKIIVEQRINRVIMLSVLQYYQNKADVRRLILSLKETAAKQKFSCLLADIIPVKHSAIDDILSIIKHAIKKGYTLKFVRFLMYAIFSDYRKMKKNGLLQLDELFFMDLAKEENLQIEVIKNLTLHTSRYSILINF